MGRPGLARAATPPPPPGGGGVTKQWPAPDASPSPPQEALKRLVFAKCSPSVCTTTERESAWSAVLRGLGTVSLITAGCVLLARQLYHCARDVPPEESVFELDKFAEDEAPSEASAGALQSEASDEAGQSEAWAEAVWSTRTHPTARTPVPTPRPDGAWYDVEADAEAAAASRHVTFHASVQG